MPTIPPTPAPSPPLFLRYGDMIPRKDLVYKIGHEQVRWEKLWLESVFGHQYYLDIPISSSTLVDGDAGLTPNSMFYLFHPDIDRYMNSRYYQVPKNYDSDRSIYAVVNWVAYDDKTDTGDVRWRADVYRAGDGEEIGSIDYGVCNDPNAGENLQNFAIIELPIGLNSGDCLQVKITRKGSHGTDDFTGNAQLNYIQLLIPIETGL